MRSLEQLVFLYRDFQRATRGDRGYEFLRIIVLLLHSLTIYNNVYYRLCRFLYLLPKPLNFIFFPVRILIKRIFQLLLGTDISEKADIGPGMFIAHHASLVLGMHTKAGHGLFISQCVTIGGDGKNNGHPSFGNNVVISSNCVVIGPIIIGDNVIIGACSLVNKSFESNVVVGGVPAKIIKILND